MGNYWHYVGWMDLTAWLALWGVAWSVDQVKAQPFGVVLRIINLRMGVADGSSQ